MFRDVPVFRVPVFLEVLHARLFSSAACYITQSST